MPRLENPERFARSSVNDILTKAEEAVQKELDRSRLFVEITAEQFPSFETSELVLGRVRGRGGFCVVRDITAINLQGKKAATRKGSKLFRSTSSMSSTRSGALEQTDVDASARERFARKIWSKQGGKYVVKQVEPMLLETDRVTFLKGIVDLAIETQFLASLHHPNIMQLRACCKASPFEDPDYFIVLDALSETLPKRLNSWMQMKRTTRGITGIVTGGRRKASTLHTERLLVAFDVAEALNYLHVKNVIYRDLKPDNVGFDGEGNLKIFDFGLAKELIEEEKDENGLYHLTGLTGAIRYMAPEVGLKQPYNLSADIYSWSMLMWYIMALEPPMGMYTPNMFIDRVFRKGYRPMTKDKWPSALSDLMRNCWSEKLEERPRFSCVLRVLMDEITKVDPKVATLIGDSSGELRRGVTN